MPDKRPGVAGAMLTFGPWRARPVAESDVDFAFGFLNDAGVVAARTPTPPGDLAAAAAWVDDVISDPTCVPWILESIDGDRGVGYIALQGFDPVAGVTEVGFLVVPSERKKGLATSALQAVTAWSFENLNIHRIFLVHDTTNEGSCKAAQAAGYATEGICRSARPGPDDTRIDSEQHAITRSDFESEQRA